MSRDCGFPWCRKGRRACASRYRPGTRKKIWRGRHRAGDERGVAEAGGLCQGIVVSRGAERGGAPARPDIGRALEKRSGEPATAQEMSAALLKRGVYVKGLWFPVVPKGEARLRVQISAGHSKKDLESPPPRRR